MVMEDVLVLMSDCVNYSAPVIYYLSTNIHSHKIILEVRFRVSRLKVPDCRHVWAATSIKP